MKVALVYDRVNKWGGAERVLLALQKLFPNAPLYTSVYNKKTAPWAKTFSIKTSFLQKFPFALSWHEYYATLMPLAFESFSFDSFDVVISVTSEAAKGIITKPKTLHICYCLTPTRYLWSGYDEYFKSSLLRTIAAPVVSYLRHWDKVAARRPDKIITISKEVQRRVKKYYDMESDVIYPPFGLDVSKEEKISKVSKGDYFLVVSRLVPYKRIDLAIKACNKLKFPLKIVGSGSQENALRRIAGPQVTFIGNLTDRELVKYYKGCVALIFPGIEDFGLSVVEAQSFGKPVIAYRAGGALETVVDGKTGEFFNEQTTKSLVEVLGKFDVKKYRSQDCIESAERFSSERFEKEFMSVIEESLKAYL